MRRLAIVVLGVVILLAVICLLAAVPVHTGMQLTDNSRAIVVETNEHQRQVVLTFDHKTEAGDFVVVPHGIVVFTLVPSTPQTAPLPPGSYMVCHMLTLRVVDPSGDHAGVGFRCGEDKFLLKAIDIHSEEKEQ